MGEEPTTQELQIEQLKRELAERESARQAPTEDAEEQHARRAAKAAYLREKLGERAKSEADARAEDG